MTVSAARLIANRRNAIRSTGPVTEEGKQRSKLNAWKHGLRAEGEAMPEEEAEAVEARLREWGPSLPAGDAYQRWLVRQVATHAVRIDRCQAHQQSQEGSTRPRGPPSAGTSTAPPRPPNSAPGWRRTPAGSCRS